MDKLFFESGELTPDQENNIKIEIEYDGTDADCKFWSIKNLETKVLVILHLKLK